MEYREIYQDLFTVDESYTLAHCISADCKMGAGVATQFVKHNPFMRDALLSMNPKIGDVLYYKTEERHGVLNLITKERYFHKPTRKNFNNTINKLKEVTEKYQIKKIAMPLIGSGLDRLDWDESRNWIKEVFKDTDVEILVCKFR